MAIRLLLLGLTLWAASVTYVICFHPDIAMAVNNRILRRETIEGHTFLSRDSGPEVFVAFGNESHVFCSRPCTIEEAGMIEEKQAVMMCDSQWDGRKHLCSARFWPGREYIVQAKVFGRAAR